MSNVANLADYRSADFIPANDTAPTEAPKAQTNEGAGRTIPRALRFLAYGILKTAQVLAFGVLTVLRLPIRFALGAVALGMTVGLPMFWFGYPEGSHERTLFVTVAIASIVGAGLFRFFYDALLARLDPRNSVAD